MAGTRKGAIKAAETRAERHEAIMRDLAHEPDLQATYQRCRQRVGARTVNTALDWLHDHSAEVAATQAMAMELSASLHESVGSWTARRAASRVSASELRARLDSIPCTCGFQPLPF